MSALKTDLSISCPHCRGPLHLEVAEIPEAAPVICRTCGALLGRWGLSSVGAVPSFALPQVRTGDRQG